MSASRYPVPVEPCRCIVEVQRSRFISSIEQAESPEAALQFIARIKQEFPDASHNCWAYLIGPPGSTDRIGLSDDGEPHGVAGKPMLTTLQHAGIGDIAVVVSRYFGGIKLGKGGMVKAYTLAVQTNLQQLRTTEKIDWAELSLSFSYPLLSPIEQLLPEFETTIMARKFTDQVVLQLKLPAERITELSTRLNDLSAGQIEFKPQQ